jgi:hypothetical protein
VKSILASFSCAKIVLLWLSRAAFLTKSRKIGVRSKINLEISLLVAIIRSKCLKNSRLTIVEQ